MRKEIYDKVGTVSVLLNEKLDELKDCAKEKEDILQWVDELTNKGLLEQNVSLVRKKISDNLARFKKVVADIEAINKGL